MATYEIQTEDGAVYEIETAEDGGGKISDFPLSTLLDVGKETGKAVTKEIAKPILNFGRGVVSGATMGAINNPPILQGSVMQPESPFPFNVGRFAGTAIPIVAAEMTGGSALGMGAAARGAGILGRSVARGIGTGMTYGAAESAVSGVPLPVAAKNIGVSGLAFGSLGAVGRGIGKIREIFGNKLPATIYEKVLETNKLQNMSDLHKVGRTLGDRAADVPGLYGSKETMLDQVTSRINQLEKQLDIPLKNMSEDELKAGFSIVNKKMIVSSLKSLMSDFKYVAGNVGRNAKNSIEKTIDDVSKYPSKMTVEMANNIKRKIYSVINNRAFLKQVEENPAAVQSLRNVASTIRGAIADASPEIKAINAEQSLLIGLRDSLQDSLVKDVGKFSDKFVGPAVESVSTRLAHGLRSGLGVPLPRLSTTSRQVARTASLPILRLNNENP